MSAPAAPRRADALRNRARVLAAAAEVFAERGVAAGVPEIAERAGVGKATVYRSFPTKEHLIAAIVIERLADFERRVRERLDAPDAFAALQEIFADGAERGCADRSLKDALGDPGQLPEVTAARAAVWDAVGELMDRARAQGGIRADARPDDLRVLWAGTARLLAAEGERDPAVWRRYAELALRALKA